MILPQDEDPFGKLQLLIQKVDTRQLDLRGYLKSVFSQDVRKVEERRLYTN